jgi:methionyl-tRNA formyltransferase
MKTIVAFLSRPHGFNVLKYLINSKEYKLIKLYTHSLNPKSQDPQRKNRQDFELFENLCKNNEISIEIIDEKKDIELDIPQCDFIVEVSWRYLISETVTKKAKIGAFGIHRGKLPEYGGAEPIKQALEKEENEIILSAHFLDSVIDSGSTITSISHPIDIKSNLSLEENIQKIRDEITPLFSIVVDKAFKILEKEKSNS